MNEDYWAITAIHEAAHGIVAFSLECHPVQLFLHKRGKGVSGECVARFEKSWYGEVASILSQNAPFVAHQYECLPSGEKGDLHERTDAFVKFSKLIGAQDETLFRRHIDEPLLGFFAHPDIQAATLALGTWLHKKRKLSLSQVGRWRKTLELPIVPCESLSQYCLSLAEAFAS